MRRPLWREGSVAHLADEAVFSWKLGEWVGTSQVNQKADCRASSEERTVCCKGPEAEMTGWPWRSREKSVKGQGGWIEAWRWALQALLPVLNPRLSSRKPLLPLKWAQRPSCRKKSSSLHSHSWIACYKWLYEPWVLSIKNVPFDIWSQVLWPRLPALHTGPSVCIKPACFFLYPLSFPLSCGLLRSLI